MFSRNSRTVVLPVLMAVALLGLPAYSSTLSTYSTASSWQLALSNFQTIDFGGFAPANGFTNYGAGFVLNGVSFIGLGGTNGTPPITVFDTAFSQWYNFGTGDAPAIPTFRASTASVPYLHITLPAAITAVGFNIFSVGPTALPYTIAVSDGSGPVGQYTAPTSPLPTPAFFGITSDNAFTTLDLTLQGTIFSDSTYAFIDNFSFGAAQLGTEGGPTDGGDVPETSTSLLFGAGLTGIGLLRRRNKPTIQQ